MLIGALPAIAAKVLFSARQVIINRRARPVARLKLACADGHHSLMRTHINVTVIRDDIYQQVALENLTDDELQDCSTVPHLHSFVPIVLFLSDQSLSTSVARTLHR